MNRRSLFKSLLALPVVAAFAPLLPKAAPGSDPVSLVDRLKMAMTLYQHQPSLISASAIDAMLGPGMYKLDISDVLYASLKSEQALGSIFEMEPDIAPEFPKFQWTEDA